MEKLLSFINLNIKGKNGIYDPFKNNFDFIYNNSISYADVISISPDETQIACGIASYLYLFNNQKSGVVETIKTTSDISDIVIPNPSEKNVTVKFKSPFSGITKIFLIDDLGNEISQLYEGHLDSGENDLLINLPKLSNGTYFLNIQGTNYNKSLKLSIVK